MDTISWSINATTIRRNLHSHGYKLGALNYQSQIKGDDPQPIYQNRLPHMDIIRSRDLSTPLPMGAILSAIDINPKLVTIYPKLKGMILNLFC